jgi:hypothetical protein
MLTYKKNIEEAIRRHQAFWNLEPLNPPLIFIQLSDPGVRTLDHQSYYWDKPDDFLKRLLPDLQQYVDFPDDALPRVRPPFSHAALPAMLGCNATLVNDALWAEPLGGAAEEILEITFRPEGPFGDRFTAYYEFLLKEADGHFLINNYEIMGPVDLLSALMGNQEAVMLSVDNPDLFGRLLLRCAEIGRAFSAWQEHLTDGQFCWGGKLCSCLWAPPGTMHTSDHGNILYSPKIYRDSIMPAEARLLEGSKHVAFFGYFVDGRHIAEDILSHSAIDFAHGCEALLPVALMKKHVGTKRFLIKCQPQEIPALREELGDTGIAFWTFANGVDDARRIVDALLN